MAVVKRQSSVNSADCLPHRRFPWTYRRIAGRFRVNATVEDILLLNNLTIKIYLVFYKCFVVIVGVVLVSFGKKRIHPQPADSLLAVKRIVLPAGNALEILPSFGEKRLAVSDGGGVSRI